MKNFFIGTFLMCLLELVGCQHRNAESEQKNKKTDSIKSKALLEQSEVDSVDGWNFIEPEGKARFPGGQDSLMSFILKNFNYSETDGGDGIAFVQFVVNEDGTLSEFKILKGLNPEFNKNAIEVLKKMPKWIPGEINSVPVKQKIIVPVGFYINE